MSKTHQLTQTTICSSSSSSQLKKKKLLQQSSIACQTSIDDECGSSFFNHNRLSNGLDVLNRSSSNETSGEHMSVATISPNLTNLLTITRVGIGSLKKLEENRILLSNQSTPIKARLLHRHGSRKARKALRTITVIMGAFVLCWTPVSQAKFN
jgi:hypothetical protein